MLILLLPAQHCFPPQNRRRGEAFETADCQTSDKSQLKPILMRFFQVVSRWSDAPIPVEEKTAEQIYIK